MPRICRCQAYGYVTPIYSSLFLRSDPKKGSPGSSSSSPARCSTETQDVASSSAKNLADIVLSTFPVPRRAGAEKTALLIP